MTSQISLSNQAETILDGITRLGYAAIQLNQYRRILYLSMSKGTILCMFSGGIDSSGVLDQLFTNPEFQQRPLIVHHIYLQNRENRADAEAASVSKIISYYKKQYPDRNFTYTNSVFNTTGFVSLKAARFPFDVDVCAFVAGNICVARKDIRQVATGRTKTDMDTGGISHQRRITRAQCVFRSVYSLEPEKLPELIFRC